MAFIRQKTVGGKKYYQVVRNYREEGKHKQEVLCHLGRHQSLTAAVAEVREEVTRLEEAAATRWEEAHEAKVRCLDNYGNALGGRIPSKNEVHPQWRALCYDRPWEYQLRESYSLNGEDKEHWQDDWRTKCLMYEAIFTYHTLLDMAGWHEQMASAHRMRLIKLLAVKEKYF